jgi:hypothetical protein
MSSSAAGPSTPHASDLLPPPLESSVFLSDSFDTDAFLVSRRHTPLDELRAELRACLNQTKSELVKVINSDYEDFVNLGRGLTDGFEDAWRDLDRAVRNVRKEVDVRVSSLSRRSWSCSLIDPFASSTGVMRVSPGHRGCYRRKISSESKHP